MQHERCRQSTRRFVYWKTKVSTHPQSYNLLILSKLHSQCMEHTYHDHHCQQIERVKINKRKLANNIIIVFHLPQSPGTNLYHSEFLSFKSFKVHRSFVKQVNRTKHEASLISLVLKSPDQEVPSQNLRQKKNLCPHPFSLQ